METLYLHPCFDGMEMKGEQDIYKAFFFKNFNDNGSPSLLSVWSKGRLISEGIIISVTFNWN